MSLVVERVSLHYGGEVVEKGERGWRKKGYRTNEIIHCMVSMVVKHCVLHKVGKLSYISCCDERTIFAVLFYEDTIIMCSPQFRF